MMTGATTTNDPSVLSCSWRPNPASGRPPACWAATASAGARLDYACSLLRHHGVEVCPAFDADPATARSILRRIVDARWPDGDGSFVFWTRSEQERFFDRSSTTVLPLPVYLDAAVTARAVEAALRLAGLTVTHGSDPDTLHVSDQRSSPV